MQWYAGFLKEVVGSPEYTEPGGAHIFVYTFLSFLSCYGDPGLQGHCQSLQLYCEADMCWTEKEHIYGLFFGFWNFTIFSRIQKLTSNICIGFLYS